MSTILAYISRELQKLLYVLQWGEQVSAKNMCDVYDMLSTQ